MSKQIFAKQFDTDREYEQAKRTQRKADRTFRTQRKSRKGVWQAED